MVCATYYSILFNTHNTIDIWTETIGMIVSAIMYIFPPRFLALRNLIPRIEHWSRRGKERTVSKRFSSLQLNDYKNLQIFKLK